MTSAATAMHCSLPLGCIACAAPTVHGKQHQVPVWLVWLCPWSADLSPVVWCVGVWSIGSIHMVHQKQSEQGVCGSTRAWSAHLVLVCCCLCSMLQVHQQHLASSCCGWDVAWAVRRLLCSVVVLLVVLQRLGHSLGGLALLLVWHAICTGAACVLHDVHTGETSGRVHFRDAPATTASLNTWLASVGCCLGSLRTSAVRQLHLRPAAGGYSTWPVVGCTFR